MKKSELLKRIQDVETKVRYLEDPTQQTVDRMIRSGYPVEMAKEILYQDKETKQGAPLYNDFASIKKSEFAEMLLGAYGYGEMSQYPVKDREDFKRVIEEWWEEILNEKA